MCYNFQVSAPLYTLSQLYRFHNHTPYSSIVVHVCVSDIQKVWIKDMKL